MYKKNGFYIKKTDKSFDLRNFEVKFYDKFRIL